MKRTEVTLALGALLAVTLPAAMLDLSAGAERRAAGLSAAPFAWRNVLVAHLTAALPLGLALAAWLRSQPLFAASARWPWAALGVVSAGLLALASAPSAVMIVRSDPGALPLLCLRSLLALLLVLPWCLAALGPGAAGRAALPDQPLLLTVGLGLALVPCHLYVEGVILGRSQEAATLLAQRRLVRAEALIEGLCELGSQRPIGQRLPAELRPRLSGMLRQAREQLSAPFATSSAPAQRANRAILLVELERLDEAAALLEPLVPAHDGATLMLASVYSNQQRWAQSDRLYAALLEKQLSLVDRDSTLRSRCRAIFAALAENARLAGRPADAEAILYRGLEALPADAAHFHLLLGRHYHEAGRNGLALEHLQLAARFDRKNFGSAADELIQQIRTATPGCLSAGAR